MGRLLTDPLCCLFNMTSNDNSSDSSEIITTAQVHSDIYDAAINPQLENNAVSSHIDAVHNSSETWCKVSKMSSTRKTDIHEFKFKSVHRNMKGVLPRTSAARLYKKIGTTIPVKTNNVFQPLLEDPEIEIDNSISHQPTSQMDSSTTEEKSANSQNGSRKHKPPPPIVVTSKVDYFKLQQTLKNSLQILAEGKFSPVGLKLYVSTKDDFEKLQDYLILQKYNFYTFPYNTSKVLKVVLKGLPNESSSEEILTELQSLNYPIESVRQLRKRVQDENTGLMTWLPMPIWVLTVNQLQDKPDIRQLRSLCYLRVEIEDYISRQGAIQCYKCQGFGHKTHSCHIQPRCVKCGENHDSHSCRKPTSIPAKCANCQGDHPANFRQCPKYQAYVNGVKTRNPAHKKQPDLSAQSFPPLPVTEQVIKGFRKVNIDNNTRQTPGQFADSSSFSQLFHELREWWNFLKTFNISYYLRCLHQTFLQVKQQNDMFNKISVFIDGVSSLFGNGTK